MVTKFDRKYSIKLPASYETSTWKGFFAETFIPLVPHAISVLSKQEIIAFTKDKVCK